MNFDLSEEQKMLADQASGLLGERSSPDRLRELIDTGAEWDEPLWRELAGMGFLGAAIPEEFGGVGMTRLDLAVLSEALGRANTALPFFSSIVLAAEAIALGGSDEQKAKWLPALASGETVATFAYAEGPGDWKAGQLKAIVRDGLANGTKWPVADAGVADITVVLASDVAGGCVLGVVELDQPGVTRTRLESFDQLRAHYELIFRDAAFEPLGGAPASTVLPQLFDRAAVQAAFEAVGGADACLRMARDYAMERQIFGRPLAGYQAIKHKLADIFVDIELARSSAYYAAWAATYGEDELPAAAAAARLSATGAFEKAARENIQVHGGIGYTFEANCHFYYRRERTLASAIGNRQHWANRLVESFLNQQPNAAEAA